MKCITNFELLLQKEQKMDVGQATLLELNSEDKPLDMTKHTGFYIIVVIIREQIVVNLLPTRVCGHGEEDIRFSTVSSYCH